MAGVANGARQVEVAVNGIGERAGNCSLEEIAMIVSTRGQALGLSHGLTLREIARTSRLVSLLTGYSVQRNKAIVGENAFAHESGIHQHGVLQDRLTYEIITAEEIGVEGGKIVLSFRHTGGGLLAKGGPLTGFTIAGRDRRFVNAEAKIDGDTVIVWSAKVPHPVAVRFGWADYPVVNLWNGAGLPASPFKTDDFPWTTRMNK